MTAMTKTPEEWLNEVSPEKARGIFKLFLGYAPGVGKTYSMLSEAIRRASRGAAGGSGIFGAGGRASARCRPGRGRWGVVHRAERGLPGLAGSEHG